MKFLFPFLRRIRQKYANESPEILHRVQVLLKLSAFFFPVGVYYFIEALIFAPVFLPDLISHIIMFFSSFTAIYLIAKMHLNWATFSLFFNLYALALISNVIYDALTPDLRPLDGIFLTVCFISIIDSLYYFITLGIKYTWLIVSISNGMVVSHCLVLIGKTTEEFSSNAFYMFAALALLNLATFIANQTILHHRRLKHDLMVKERVIQDSMTKLISGFIPICASCKAIRETSGEWVSIEKYFERKGQDVVLSHGYCEKCGKKIMEEIDMFPKRT